MSCVHSNFFYIYIYKSHSGLYEFGLLNGVERGCMFTVVTVYFEKNCRYFIFLRWDHTAPLWARLFFFSNIIVWFSPIFGQIKRRHINWRLPPSKYPMNIEAQKIWIFHEFWTVNWDVHMVNHLKKKISFRQFYMWLVYL